MVLLYERCNTGEIGASDVYGALWRAQTFTVGATWHTITAIKLKMYKTGNPGTLIINTYATDEAGHPTGGVKSGGTMYADALTTNPAGSWYEMPISEFLLLANTKYAIVLGAPNGDANNRVNFLQEPTGVIYTEGNRETSINSRASWTADTFDILFEVWGNPGPPVYGRATVTGTAKGGFPIPSMRLEIYQNDVRVKYGETPSSALQLNAPYQISYDIVTLGDYTFYGKMILTNPLKQMVFESQRQSVTTYPSFTIVTTADGWVNNLPANVDSNFNAHGLGIGVWGGGLNRSFLSFNLYVLSVDPSKITKVELKLYGARIHSTAKARAYFMDGDFNEATLTWRNQPPPTILPPYGSLMGETGGIPDAAAWYTVPLNPVFAKDRWYRSYRMILMGTEEPESYCWARDKEEAGGAYAPRLVVTTE